MSGYGPFLYAFACALIFLAHAGGNIRAQNPPHQDPSSDTLARKIRMLEKELDTIKETISRQQQQDELEALIREAEQLSTREEATEVDLSRKFFSGVRQQQGLNPNISFGMDFFGGFSTSDAPSISEPSDIAYGSNGFYLREAQLSLIAPLDPFTRGKGFISATRTEVFLDEVYMEWLNLPLGTNLKAGYFRPEFGFLNRYHDHALPQFDRPRVLVNMFGTEGLSGSGVATNFLLPAVIAHATSLDLSLVYGNSPTSFLPDSTRGFMIAGQLLNYYDLSPGSYIEIRLSGTGGNNDRRGGPQQTFVGSAGIAYKWAPVGRQKYRTLEWKTEWIYSYREEGAGNLQSHGFYSSIRNKLGARFWIGGRVGYSQLPYDPSQSEWDYTLNLDFWQSDFVMTRLQYQYNNRKIVNRTETEGPYPSNHSVTIQVSWAMGPHKHEAY